MIKEIKMIKEGRTRRQCSCLSLHELLSATAPSSRSAPLPGSGAPADPTAPQAVSALSLEGVASSVGAFSQIRPLGGPEGAQTKECSR